MPMNSSSYLRVLRDFSPLPGIEKIARSLGLSRSEMSRRNEKQPLRIRHIATRQNFIGTGMALTLSGLIIKCVVPSITTIAKKNEVIGLDESGGKSISFRIRSTKRLDNRHAPRVPRKKRYLMIEIAMSLKDVRTMLHRQLTSLFPLNESEMAAIDGSFHVALDRCERSFSRNLNKYFRSSSGSVWFNPLHGCQWAMFLYFLSNSIWHSGDRGTLSV